MIINVAIILSIVSIILCIVALVLGGAAVAMIIGLKNSTHKIEFRPMNFEHNQYTDKDLEDKLDESGFPIMDDDPWSGRGLIKKLKTELYDPATEE